MRYIVLTISTHTKKLNKSFYFCKMVKGGKLYDVKWVRVFPSYFYARDYNTVTISPSIMAIIYDIEENKFRKCLIDEKVAEKAVENAIRMLKKLDIL